MKKWIIRIFVFFLLVIFSIAGYIYVKKEEIKHKAIDGINQKLDAKITVNDKIEITFFKTFPNVTLELNKVFIEDKFNKNDTLANVETINFTINPLSLLDEELSIKSIILRNGIVRLKTYKDGKSNYDILKKDDSKKDNSAKLNLEKIIIEKIDLIYDDLRSKIYINTFINDASFSGKFYNKDFDIFVKLNATAKKLLISEISFLNKNKVQANFDLFYKAENKCISFKENNIDIDGTNFNCFGDICTETNHINLSAKAKGSSLKNGLKLIPKSLFQLNGISGNGKYNIDILLTGKLNKPKINIDFNLENATAKIEEYNLEVDDLYSSGSFSNIPKNNLIINEFTLKSGKTFLNGSMKIPDLDSKKMELVLDGEIDMPLLEKFKLKSIELNSGTTKFQNLFFNFNYRIQDSIWVATKLLGNIVFDNVQGEFNKIQQDFELNGDLKFVNKKVNIKNIDLLIGKNDIQYSGIIKNSLNFFQNDIFGTNDALVLKGKLKSTVFDINDFLENNSVGKDTSDNKYNLLKWLNVIVDINFKVDKLIYKKLEVNDIKSKIISKEAGLFSFRNLKANSLGGKANGDVEIRFFNNRKLEVFISSKLKNIEIKKLFTDLENFGQTALTDKNIKGKLDAKLTTSMVFKNFTEFQASELILQTDFVLNDGELIKLKSLESLSNYLSIDQLEHIYFSTYKSSISIVNKVLKLNNSEIQSNLISLDIGGTHSFDNEIDYAIKLNLKNLLATKFKKKKTLDKDYVNNVKGGINIFISMKGTVDNPIIKMDKKNANLNLKENLKNEKENLKDLFKKDKTFFENEEELYFEDEEEFIEFE